MIRKSVDLLAISVFAVAALLFTLLGVSNPLLRLLFGVPLVLFLPGYALIAAIFPWRELHGAERFLFTASASLSVTIMCGFVLNRTPWGLRPESWAVMLSDMTLGASMVAFVRRQFFEPPHRASAQEDAMLASQVPNHPRFGFGVGQIVLLGLAGTVLASAILLARHEAALRPDPNVLQLWMLPGAQANPPTIRIGVNSAGMAGTYRLQIQHGDYIIREWPVLTLTSGQQWQEVVTLQARQPGTGAFEARLYRTDAPDVVYRRVALWLDTPE